jgi:hypothetical protein
MMCRVRGVVVVLISNNVVDLIACDRHSVCVAPLGDDRHSGSTLAGMMMDKLRLAGRVDGNDTVPWYQLSGGL